MVCFIALLYICSPGYSEAPLGCTLGWANSSRVCDDSTECPPGWMSTGTGSERRCLQRSGFTMDSAAADRDGQCGFMSATASDLVVRSEADLQLLNTTCARVPDRAGCWTGITYQANRWVNSLNEVVSTLVNDHTATSAPSLEQPVEGTELLWVSQIGIMGEQPGFQWDDRGRGRAVVCELAARNCTPGCEACAAGSFATNDTCISCPAETYGPPEITSADNCTITCTGGTYWNNEAGHCEPCPMGTGWSGLETGVYDEVCIPCPGANPHDLSDRGSFAVTQDIGATPEDSCMPCPPDTRAILNGSSVCSPRDCGECGEAWWIRVGSLAACAIKPGFCSVVDGWNPTQCTLEGTRMPSKDDLDVHASCFTCQPGVSTKQYTYNPGAGCDDGDACTTGDSCDGGFCRGTAYDTCLRVEFTRDMSLHCEDCDGRGGCTVAADYGGVVLPDTTSSHGRVCGCNITDGNTTTLVKHGDLNPSNPCQLCDVTIDATAWQVRPDGSRCSDNKSCTVADTCSAGICVGTPYTCAAQPCHSRYECDGLGGCISELHSAADRHICQPPGADTDCAPALVCDGLTAACPTYSSRQPSTHPSIQVGSVQVLHGNLSDQQSVWTNKPLSTGARAILEGNDSVSVELSGFGVRCDDLWVRWGIAHVATPENALSCDWTDTNRTASPGPAHDWSVLVDTQPRFTLAVDHAGLAGGGFETLSADSTNLNSHNRTGALSSGQQYKVVVEVVNVLNETALVCSDVFVADATAPNTINATIREVDVAAYTLDAVSGADDVDYQSNPAITVHFSGISDPESAYPVPRVEIAVVTEGQADDTAVWTEIQDVGSYTVNSPLMTVQGQKYTTLLRGVNRAGLKSAIVRSDGVILDTTPPELGGWYDVRPETPLQVENAQHTSHQSELAFRWTGANDTIAPIVECQVGVGSVVGRFVDNVVEMQLCDPYQQNYTVVLSNLALTDSTHYFGLLELVNAAGLVTRRSTNGVLTDLSSPHVDPPLWLGLDDSLQQQWYGPGYDALRTAITAQRETGTVRMGVSFSDEGSGFSHCEVQLGTTAGTDDISAWTKANTTRSLPDAAVVATGSVTLSGLSITAGAQVYGAVRCCDMAGNCAEALTDGPLVVSPTATIDVSSAEVTHVAEDWTGQTQVVAARRDGRIEVEWAGFVSSEVVAFDWAITDTPVADAASHAWNVLDWTRVTGGHTKASTTAGSPVLVHGHEYVVAVRAWASNGASAIIVSDSCVYDTTPPDVTGLSMTPPSDAATYYQAVADTFPLSWSSPVTDTETAVIGVQGRIGLCGSSDFMVSPWANAVWTDKNTTQATLAELSLQHGVCYHAEVRFVNEAGGMSASLYTDDVHIDTTAPVTAAVFIGGRLNYQRRFQPSGSYVALAWAADNGDRLRPGWKDPESGITEYHYCLSSDSRGTCCSVQCDVVDWTSTGNTTSVNATGLALRSGTAVRGLVRATNQAGVGSIACSDVMTIDLTTPNVTDALLEVEVSHLQVAFVGATQTLRLQWRGVNETDARRDDGIQQLLQYEVSVREAGSGVEVIPTTNVGFATEAEFHDTDLQAGVEYLIRLVVVSADGQVADLVREQPITIDDTPPDASQAIPSIVGLTSFSGVSWISSGTSIVVTWEPVLEPESPLTLSISLGTTSHGQQLVPLSPTDGPTRHTFHNISLAFDGYLVVTLVAANAQGAWASAISQRIAVDGTPPHKGTVWTGTMPGKTALYLGKHFLANWAGFVEDRSGIQAVEVGVMIAAAPTAVLPNTGPDVVGWESVPVFQQADGTASWTQAIDDSMALDGKLVRIAVRVTNGAGLQTLALSPAVRVIRSATGGGAVLDGADPAVDVQVLQDCSALPATWGGYSSQSSLTFAIAAASYPYTNDTRSPDLVNWRLVGHSQFGVFQLNASNLAGRRVYTWVRATNAAGYSSVLSSDGVLCDDLAPAPITSVYTADLPPAHLFASHDRTTCVCGGAKPRYDATSRECTCDFGHYWNASAGACEACPAQAPVGAEAACSATATATTASGSTADGCSPGRYRQTRGGDCKLCPPGSSKPSYGDDIGMCVPCSNAYTRDIVYKLMPTLLDGSHSPLAGAVVAAGSTLEGTQLLKPAYVTIDNVSAVDIPSLSVSTHTRPHLSLTAVNSAGRTTVSRVVMPSTTNAAPATSRIQDFLPTAQGTMVSGDTSVSDGSVLGLRWAAWDLAQGDSVEALYCAFGSAPGLSDVVDWHTINTSSLSCSAQPSDPRALHRTSVYGSVQVFTVSGATTMVSSDGVRVTSSPPSIASVWMSNRPCTAQSPTGEQVLRHDSAYVCWLLAPQDMADTALLTVVITGTTLDGQLPTAELAIDGLGKRMVAIGMQDLELGGVCGGRNHECVVESLQTVVTACNRVGVCANVTASAHTSHAPAPDWTVRFVPQSGPHSDACIRDFLSDGGVTVQSSVDRVVLEWGVAEGIVRPELVKQLQIRLGVRPNAYDMALIEVAFNQSERGIAIDGLHLSPGDRLVGTLVVQGYDGYILGRAMATVVIDPASMPAFFTDDITTTVLATPDFTPANTAGTLRPQTSTPTQAPEAASAPLLSAQTSQCGAGRDRDWVVTGYSSVYAHWPAWRDDESGLRTTPYAGLVSEAVSYQLEGMACGAIEAAVADGLLLPVLAGAYDAGTDLYEIEWALDPTVIMAYKPYRMCVVQANGLGVWGTQCGGRVTVVPAPMTTSGNVTVDLEPSMRQQAIQLTALLDGVSATRPADSALQFLGSQSDIPLQITVHTAPQTPLPWKLLTIEVWSHGLAARTFSHTASAPLDCGTSVLRLVLPSDAARQLQGQTEVRVVYTDVFGRNTTQTSAAFAADNSPPQPAPVTMIYTPDKLKTTPDVQPRIVASISDYRDRVSDLASEAVQATPRWLGADWANQLFSNTSSVLSISPGSDPETGVVLEWVLIGSSAFGSQVCGPRRLPVSEGPCEPGQIQHLNWVWVTTVAANGAHLIGADASLMGRIDLLPPTPTTAGLRSTLAGPAAQTNGVTYLATLAGQEVAWRPWRDGASRMHDTTVYTVSARMTRRGNDTTTSQLLRTRVSCGTSQSECVLSLDKTFLPLDAATFVIEISAADVAGNIATSKPLIVIVDTTPPMWIGRQPLRHGPALGDVARCQVEFDLRSAVTEFLHFNWDPAVDPESSITGYRLCIGSIVAPERYWACRSVGLVQQMSVPATDLLSIPLAGVGVVGRVYAENGAGLAAVTVSAPLRVLCNPDLESCPERLQSVQCV